MDAPDYRAMPIGVRHHFFDSGAFSMWAWAKKWQAEVGAADRWGYYDTPAHWDYVDRYCAFIVRYAAAIDHFANVDAIGSPELTYRNQRYMETEWGLKPVPVVHAGTDVKWLKQYMADGHDYVGLGLAGMKAKPLRHWLDECFGVICDTPDRLPKIRTHGFAITRFSLFFRYPWFSTDSKSWSDYGAYGGILVPQWVGGKFVFDRNPYLMKIGTRSPYRAKAGYHYDNLPPLQKTLVKRWLDECGLPLGKSAPDGEVMERGAVNDHCVRKDASIMVFEGMKAAVPKYPWPWKPKTLLRGFH